MKRFTLLKSMLLLCALVAGSMNGWADTYVKVTSNSDLVSGDVYIIATTSAVATSFSSNILNTTASGFSESSGTITTTTATPMEFTLGITNANYTLKNGNNYLGYAGSKTNLRTQTVTSDTKEQWTIAYDGTYTMYTIVNVATPGRFIGTGDASFRCYANMGANAPATLYRKTAVSVTTPASGFVTFASPSALNLASLPSGLTAYKVEAAKVTSSKVTLTQVTEAVKPYTPLILVGDADNYDIPVTTSTNDISASNALKKGTGAAVAWEDGKSKFVLQGGKFKKIVSGTPATVPATKAYIEVTGDISANELTLDFDETTGISEVGALKSERNEFFNLNGQRVSANHKGLVIVNGKKYMNK